MKNKGAK